ICKLDSLKAEDTARAAVRRALKTHKERVHTIIMEEGKEAYQQNKTTKALKAETYYRHPYNSWAKGVNAYSNG
ncbi:IS30 family transposase, partial [Neisseria meningitidis]|nr:IS30 family transposase [Neisseria meningitidis]